MLGMSCFVRWLLLAALLVRGPAAYAGDVIVAAAASLADAFKAVAGIVETRYPGSRILLNFSGSGVLLQQLANGAPVDVFASADQETMDQAEKLGLIRPGERTSFARNALVLVVPLDSKLSLGTLADLGKDEVKRIAMGNPALVASGRYARRALETANLRAACEGKMIPVHNVRQALDYVARGEVDAGFVYATDAVVMRDRVKVAFTIPVAPAVTYPIAVTARSVQQGEAKRLIQFLLSPSGQNVLARYGFLPL